MFPHSFDFDRTTRHYTIRNYTEQFVKNLAEKYYIVVFTSAVQGYADNIIEHIDPE
jgi:TFIIF-interacting CTD phosphatase-like protein